MIDTIPEHVFEQDGLLAQTLKSNGLALTLAEARSIRERLNRPPTLPELFIFDIEWSEHCSYKSSKALLKKYLPTTGAKVIQGPEEDAGIIELAVVDGERYGIVIAHESHNHPSQVLPFEGAATGIGGIVRDVDCMGAQVIGSADPLRFGDPNGKHAERTKSIAQGVIEGIWQYGNALGVPNLGGDIVFDSGFDDNCLVNVVAIGLVKERDILHSRAPASGVGYDLILVGKPTDYTGLGGASFASGTLDQSAEEENKGAVQVPDPFLKNVLLHRKANEAVWKRARELGLEIGMKDLGAGGIACASSEMGASAGFGIEIDLDCVHVAFDDTPSQVILCAETQERYLFAVPPEFTAEVLKIYNKDWDLPRICSNAGASKIGRVIQEPIMRILRGNEVVCDLPIDFVVEGISYKRESRASQIEFPSSSIPGPQDISQIMLRLLGSPNIGSRHHVYHHYDTEIQGNIIIRSGEADAGVIAPIDGNPAGMAIAVDGNPFYGKVSPYWGGATAVAEAMRNVAAVGARPTGLTDCLNYGNPEVPEDFWALEEGIKGISEAARNLYDPKGSPDPIPFVSGNVSLYNRSVSGVSIPPSPIICCIGVLEDYAKAITMDLKNPGHVLLLAGDRFAELGGSAYERILGLPVSKDIPNVRYERERGLIYGTVEAIEQGLVSAAHDISDGGLLIALAEMILVTHPGSDFGLAIDLQGIITDLRPDLFLFSESSGFVLEAQEKDVPAIERIYNDLGVNLQKIGSVTDHKKLSVTWSDKRELLNLSVREMREAWENALRGIFT
ncbi:MAG: phosphoribosylformylglycinamidine synthase subunit PurL [bacterium]